MRANGFLCVKARKLVWIRYIKCYPYYITLNLHNFFSYEIKFIANLTRPWLAKWRPCLVRYLSDMLLFSKILILNCENCSLTRFTVAYAFRLSQHLVGIAKMTRQFCRVFLMNCLVLIDLALLFLTCMIKWSGFFSKISIK